MTSKVNTEPAVGARADGDATSPGGFLYFGILHIFRFALVEAAVQDGNHAMQGRLLGLKQQGGEEAAENQGFHIFIHICWCLESKLAFWRMPAKQ